MSQTLPDIDYDFRVSTDTDRTSIREHIKALKENQSYMFDGIDLDSLMADPEAVNILTAACHSVALAVEAHENSEKPFYLALGENHSYPAHKIHHMLVINELRNAGVPFEISLEKSTDRITSYFLEEYFKEGPEHAHISIPNIKRYLEDNFVLEALLDIAKKPQPHIQSLF